jgi:DNA replication regulator DPB11
MDVTHLVIGATTSPKYKFVAKNSPDVHVVLPEFMREMRLAWMEGGDIDLDEFHEKYRVPTFYKLRISLTGFVDRMCSGDWRGRHFTDSDTIAQVRDQLIKFIQDNGAEYCPDLDRTVTHLIAKHPSGRKYEGAAGRAVMVVAEEWLRDSIERGMVLDEALYDVRMEPEKRGLDAWKKDHVPTKFSLGKRSRLDEASVDQSSRRKIRRTMSAKLGSAHDAMWAEIKARPVGKQSQDGWQDNVQDFSMEQNENSMADHNGSANLERKSSLQHKQQYNSARVGGMQLPKGILSGWTVFVHRFSDTRVSKKSTCSVFTISNNL